MNLLAKFRFLGSSYADGNLICFECNLQTSEIANVGIDCEVQVFGLGCDALRTMEKIVPRGLPRPKMDMSTQEAATASAGSADQTSWLHNVRL